MKRQQQEEADKIYYDVTIDHDPEHKERRYSVASKAQTNIYLKEPLIRSPGDYMLSITKFKIDTECIPLMIPEMEQPQDLIYNEDLHEFSPFRKNRLQTKYKINLYVNWLQTTHTYIEDKNGNLVKQRDPKTGNMVGIISIEEKVPCDFLIEENIEIVKHKLVDEDEENDTKYLGYAKKKDGTTDTHKAYIDNTDEQCFVYSYENFLDAINKTLKDLTNSLCIKNTGWAQFYGKDLIYFKLNNGLLELTVSYRFFGKSINTNKTLRDDGNYDTMEWSRDVKLVDLTFSPELYKYIGNGFDCSFVQGTKDTTHKGWWRYNIFKQYRNPEDNDEGDVNLPEGVTITKPASKFDPTIITQSYSALSNWNIMKAIIIGSDNLPVVEEYLPISNKDGFLTHYNTKEYKKALEDLGIHHNEIREIFKKNTQSA